MNECLLNIIRDKLHKGFFENLEYDINNKYKLRIFKNLRHTNYLPGYYLTTIHCTTNPISLKYLKYCIKN